MNKHFKLIIFIISTQLLACESNDGTADFNLTVIVLDKFQQPSSSFIQNETVQLRLTISEIVGEEIIINPSGCADRYNIYDTYNNIVGVVPGVCLPVILPDIQLNPGETYSYSTSWNLDYRDPITFLDGDILEPGTYIIEGRIPSLSKVASTTITIN